MSCAPLSIELLDKSVHDRTDFDCGAAELNDYLRFTARQHVDKGYAQVWVAVSGPGSPHVIGYYALSMTSLAPDELPRRVAVRKVPALLLGRLAVDRRHQGQKIGARLLMSAQHNALLVSQQVGVHALVVDALDDHAAAFYRKYGFEELTTGPLRLFKTIKDIERMGLPDG
ncbi:MAG: GNAT family N-acetyltransferase [Armatimonadota bacterium]